MQLAKLSVTRWNRYFIVFFIFFIPILSQKVLKKCFSKPTLKFLQKKKNLHGYSTCCMNFFLFFARRYTYNRDTANCHGIAILDILSDCKQMCWISENFCPMWFYYSQGTPLPKPICFFPHIPKFIWFSHYQPHLHYRDIPILSPSKSSS